jgi:fatty acid desaturase
MAWHPFLFGYGQGSGPHTLSYHLEHTLFPGVNYAHLPHIAPIVEQACLDHGLVYNKILDFKTLKSAFAASLSKYAKHDQLNPGDKKHN